jgi:Type IV secretion system pilin
MFILIQNLLNSIVPILVTLGVVYFVWGVVMYVIAGGEDAKTKGRDHVIYGIIGLAVIIGMWGLVGLVGRTFNLNAKSPVAPSVDFIQNTAQISSISCDAVLTSAPKLSNLLNYVTCLINNSIIPLMFALAVVFFIYGVIQFVILGAGDETKRTQGRQHMIWGVIALAVMLGVWSLAGIIGGTFGLNTRILPGVRPPTSTPAP